MIGTLILLDSGRWAVVARDREPYEITSGEVFAVDVAGVLRKTRMEFARGSSGGRYVSVDDFPLREGLRAAVGPDVDATPDELAGMDWWNVLSDDDRRRKLAYLADMGRPATVAQAWEIEKCLRAARR